MLRRCRKEDQEMWRKLNRDFMLFEYADENAWENPLKGDVEADFLHALESPCTEILLLEEEGEIIGFMHLQSFYSFWAHGKVLFLDDFFIVEKERGKGYGTKALKELEELGKAEGYKRIQLLSEKTNPGAGKFYRKSQYAEQELDLFVKYLH